MIALINALALLFGGIGTLLLGIAAILSVTRHKAENKAVSDKQKKKFTLGRIIILLVLLAIVFFIIGLVLSYFSPSVAITSPVASQQIKVHLIDTGSVSFKISGTSANIFNDPDLRIYVLVHPSEPSAEGWWIQQPATVEKNGQWSSLAWTGSPGFPPQVGHEFQVLVVAANPTSVSNRLQVSDPKELHPASQSDIVQISIGSIM